MKKSGTLIERLKQGEDIATKHQNPYIKEGVNYKELLDKSELMQQFPMVFANNNMPLIVEIGCYLGKNLIEFATNVPKANFLGLEITYKRAVTTARRIHNKGLSNAKVTLCDALTFLREIPNDSLSGICVFFPDPWPKKKHAKNRLVRDEFFTLLHTKLAPNGFFWFKTDSKSYYEEALQSAHNTNWDTPIEQIQPEIFGSFVSVTQFEELFSKKELPLYRCVFTKTIR